MESEQIREPMVSIIARPFWIVTGWFFGRRLARSKTRLEIVRLRTTVSVLESQLQAREQRLRRLEHELKRARADRFPSPLHTNAFWNQLQQTQHQNQSQLNQLAQQMNNNQAQQGFFDTTPMEFGSLLGGILGSTFKK